MTGPEHWTEADLILTGERCEYGCPHAGCEHEVSLIARAQVHATLALAVAAEDTRRLNAIRDVLGRFNWEFHDRQLTLEAIDRIVGGGQP